jgi:hypothetical protein
MEWEVAFDVEFYPEYKNFPLEVQDELLARTSWIERFGPQTGRPWVDTLKGSHFANMKELRFDAADGVWRVAFAFDPKRRAILLVAGDKSGVSEKKFYNNLIEKSDLRYTRHLANLSLNPHLKTVKEQKQ